MNEKECPYCKSKIKIKSGSPNRGSFNIHLGRCKERIKHMENLLTKDFLEEQYIILKKSAKEISDQTGASPSTLIKIMNSFGIETRNVKKAINSDRVREKIESTNIERYGSKHNFCRDHPSRIMWQKKMLDEEGIVNVWQRQSVIDKSIETLRRNENKRNQKYGSRISKPHKKVFDYIKTNISENIIMEYGVRKNDGSDKKFYYDIFLVDFNLLIEINGDYWHANPKLYKRNDILKKFRFDDLDVVAEEIWKRDKIKANLTKKHKIHLLILWEYDIKNNWGKIIETIQCVTKSGEDSEKIKSSICKKSREYLK